jgi:hypothetical protein
MVTLTGGFQLPLFDLLLDIVDLDATCGDQLLLLTRQLTRDAHPRLLVGCVLTQVAPGVLGCQVV